MKNINLTYKQISDTPSIVNIVNVGDREYITLNPNLSKEVLNTITDTYDIPKNIFYQDKNLLKESKNLSKFQDILEDLKIETLGVNNYNNSNLKRLRNKFFKNNLDLSHGGVIWTNESQEPITKLTPDIFEKMDNILNSSNYMPNCLILGYENCEWVSIPIEYIEYVDISKKAESYTKTACNSIDKVTTFEDVTLVIKRSIESDPSVKLSFDEYEDQRGSNIQQLLDRDDITSIQFLETHKTSIPEDYFYVLWNDEDECSNTYQTNVLTDENLIIRITHPENNNIEDLKEIF